MQNTHIGLFNINNETPTSVPTYQYQGWRNQDCQTNLHHFFPLKYIWYKKEEIQESEDKLNILFYDLSMHPCLSYPAVSTHSKIAE